MSKINLIIADDDLDYLDGISKFLLNNFSQKFQLSSFSNSEELLSFINKSNKKADILLVSPALYSDEIKKDIFGVVIILASGMTINKISGFEYINKYQKADDIFDKIIQIFSEYCTDNIFTENPAKKTSIASFYSCCGGAGKSLISAASAILLSKKGLKILYLNLESFQSTGQYFNENSNKSLSNLFYCLKETREKLPLKITEVACIDSKTGVHYFLPPENALEIEEMTAEDICYFINQLKAMGVYDLILIDMSGNFDSKNIAILDEADDIFFIFNSDESSMIKFSAFVRQLSIAGSFNTKVADKLWFVENKNSGSHPENPEGLKKLNADKLFKLPFVNEFMTNKNCGEVFGICKEFDFEMAKLNEIFVRGKHNVG